MFLEKPRTEKNFGSEISSGPEVSSRRKIFFSQAMAVGQQIFLSQEKALLSQVVIVGHRVSFSQVQVFISPEQITGHKVFLSQAKALFSQKHTFGHRVFSSQAMLCEIISDSENFIKILFLQNTNKCAP
jgi:hypothetical protein